MKPTILLVSAGLCGWLVPDTTAHAQAVTQELTNRQTPRSYWTIDRMRNAKPVEPPKNGAMAAPTPDSAMMPKSPPVGISGEGRAPLATKSQLPRPKTVGPALSPSDMQALASPEAPTASSQYALPFTTAQVTPAAAQVTYPYSTVGKLFFSEPTGDFVCSASVVRPRIVVTAGHCVAQPAVAGVPSSFYSNWMFVPAYNNGTEPFGQWFPTSVSTTTEWLTGGGSVPNPQDVGMFVMADQLIGGTIFRIGDLLGWLGYEILSIGGNHVTIFGYPVNLDYGEIMERTDAGNTVVGGNNTVLVGSAMGGGASGGPWIQDFGISPASTGAGNVVWQLGLNYVVGVTSYGPTGTQGYLGASVFDNSFVELLTNACNLAIDNCD